VVVTEESSGIEEEFDAYTITALLVNGITLRKIFSRRNYFSLNRGSIYFDWKIRQNLV
jgi:hypothetical protein